MPAIAVASHLFYVFCRDMGGQLRERLLDMS
jgi:hypothetical protein